MARGNRGEPLRSDAEDGVAPEKGGKITGTCEEIFAFSAEGAIYTSLGRSPRTGVWPFAVGGVLIATLPGRGNRFRRMSTETVRLVLLDTLEAALEAQLREVRQMRLSMQEKLPTKMALKFRRSRSQTEMALEVVQSAGKPLHLTEIIKAIEERFAISVDRESLGSALTKRAMRADRFVRAGKNTFGILPPS